MTVALAPKVFKQMTKLIAGSMSAGRYDVRLAETKQEVHAAQALRYEVLFKESGGLVTKQMLNAGREEDEWDDIAYHVIVLDRREENKIMGTIRLVSNDRLLNQQAFYTEHAFDLTDFLNRYPSVIELSRACVSPEGRGGAILMLMWKFTMQFIEKNKFDAMFGCASFKGQDYTQHTEILSYMYHKHLADAQLMPKPREAVNAIAIESFKVTPNKGKKRGEVPTLLRGYLKIGAKVSDHAVIDPVFNTTFVAIYVDAKKMFNTNHVLINKKH